MPIIVTCDECSESHRVKDDAVGKTFKCKGCGKSLKIKAPAPPEDDFGNFDDAEFSDEVALAKADTRQKARKQTTTKRKASNIKSEPSKPVPLRKTKVPLGIDLVYFGLLACILMTPLTLVLVFTLHLNLAFLILRWLILAIFATTTAGKLMCLTAPRHMGGRETIVVAVAIDVLSWMITVASWVTVVPALLVAVTNVLSIAGFVSFLLFLGYLGDFIGERDLWERATEIFKLGIAGIALSVLQLGLAFLAAAQAESMPLDLAGKSMGVALLEITRGIVMIILVIRYVRLLSSCRYALSNS